MKSTDVDTKGQSKNKNRLIRKTKRTQTAEGWRRSVAKICEKRKEKNDQ